MKGVVDDIVGESPNLSLVSALVARQRLTQSGDRRFSSDMRLEL